MEELESNLQNYKLQLQQVEAALTTSPDNEELLKLKNDLEEVIQLTCDLIKAQLLDDKSNSDGDLLEKELSELGKPDPPVLSAKKDWEAGDVCLALWVQDGQYYEATIESIENDEVSVIFTHNKSAEVTTLEFIKEIPRSEMSAKPKKQPMSKVREYQKKKKMKKLQRYKQLEEERETEKNKWLAFSSKLIEKSQELNQELCIAFIDLEQSHDSFPRRKMWAALRESTKKGLIKKSIFASPDNVNGRVGIGTCGVSGKGMTEFAAAEKWRKGT